MEPSWVQVGAKLTSESHPRWHHASKVVLDWILELLGLDIRHLLGSEMQPQSELKIRGVETAKFDSRIDGSSIFDVPGGEETMKNRCQNHVNIELQLDSNLEPILEWFWEPSWGPSGGQDASKTNRKFN